MKNENYTVKNYVSIVSWGLGISRVLEGGHTCRKHQSSCHKTSPEITGITGLYGKHCKWKHKGISLLIKGGPRYAEHKEVLFNFELTLVSAEDKNCMVKWQSSERQASFMSFEHWSLGTYLPQLCSLHQLMRSLCRLLTPDLSSFSGLGRKNWAVWPGLRT